MDASTQIGTGHFMRCLTLADALCQRGATVHFIVRCLPDYLELMLADRSMTCSRIGSTEDPPASGSLAHSAWLGTSQEVDAMQTYQMLEGAFWDCLIIDHYALDSTWERSLRMLVRKIVVIDDLADRMHDCDILLDQNFYTNMHERYAGKVRANCVQLLGPKYALLRHEFEVIRHSIKPRTGIVKNILVFMGGIDVNCFTSRIVHALSEMNLNGIRVNVVVGLRYPKLSEILNQCASLGFFCHVQTKEMAKLMCEADLAIGAIGSATWERCAMGVPTVAMTIADNQIKAAEDLDKKGIVINLGDAASLSLNSLKRILQNIIQDEARRVQMSHLSLNMVNHRDIDLFEILVGDHV